MQGIAGYQFNNWAQTYSSSPELFFQPANAEEVKQILDLARQRGKRVKVIGGGHSPSDIACTGDFMIRLDKMNRILEVDAEKRQVTVEAGIFLGDLNEELAQHGLALSNLGAVGEVSAAGILGTGTHNTGIEHGILPTQVVALTLMTASGEILLCSHSVNEEIFQAARLHLGCLGVILTVTFQCQAAFRLLEQQFPSTLSEVTLNINTHTNISSQLYLLKNDKPNQKQDLLRLVKDHPPHVNVILLTPLFPLMTAMSLLILLYQLCTPRLSNVCPLFFTVYLFRFGHIRWRVLVTKDALLQLKSWLEGNPAVVAHYPVEVRFTQADAILLSPCYQRDSCYMNIIMYRPYGKDVQRDEYWSAYEDIMKKVGGRPHWAKAHRCSREDFQRMYPSFQKFCSIRETLDPAGMFLNPYLEKVFF
uniref:L-gulonolactone oxidase n=1 Tax=Erpetoichthys calabaricus TaxID=27687 RepID=A0A8C4RMZ0_ERPCA